MYQLSFKLSNSRLWLVTVILFACFNAQSQDTHKVDSLRNRLQTLKGLERYDDLYELTFESAGANDYKSSLSYISEAQEIAFKFGDSLKMVKAGRVKGQVLRRLDRTADAIAEFLKVLGIARRNAFDAEYKYILNGLAIAYTYQANYDKALQYHFESLTFREKEGNKEDISIACNNIGMVYYKLQNFEKALEYYMRTMKETDTITFKDQLFINIGLCYNELGDFGKAEQYIADGLKLCEPHCSDQLVEQAEYGLGVSLIKRDKPDMAETHFKVALDLANKQNDTRLRIETLIYLANISRKAGKPEDAKAMLLEAETVATGTAYNQLIINVYKQYSEIYNDTREFEKAAIYQGKYIKLKDSIYSEELIKNLAKIQTNYEERENLKTIKDQDASLALKEETLKHQRAENRFYVVVTVLVFALAFAMLLLFRLTRRANERLESRVDARTKELNDSNDALKKVNSEMDNFIYKTSHDIRGPLASLKGICNVAILDVNDPVALGYLKKLDNTAEKLNMILTRLLIINQVNHAVLAANPINFEEIIEDILYLERKKGIPRRMNISYEVSKGFIMKSDKEMLRIVLENLIDNSIKFYNESERIEPFVRIQITAMARYVIITVTDNGVGINDETKERIFQMFVRASERSETGGIGLYLTKLATGRLEGTIDFNITPEKYTEFTVRLPLDLGPVLETRRQQERILEFEKQKQAEKQKKEAISKEP